MATEKPLQQLNRDMRIVWFFAYALAALALPASSLGADAAKRYALSERDFLQLSVPAGWSDELDQTSQPPLISFRQSKGQPFIVSVSPAWPTRTAKPASSRQELRAEVGKMADAIRLFAVEKDIKVKEFAGATGTGYYFFATDSAPAGGYKFMNRGMLKVGELSVTFTILTNEGQDGIVRAALAMLKSAAHVKQAAPR
jgi:hypothetical protein